MIHDEIRIEDDRPNYELKEAYVICTTPRSGSNLLSFTLEQQGLGIPREYLNPSRKDVYLYFSHHQQTQFEISQQYLNHDERLSQLQNIIQNNRCSENGIFGTKLMVKDLYFEPERFELFQQNMKVPTKYIVLKRRNIVEKAISMYFAFETEQWIVNHQEKPTLDLIPYDYQKIAHYMTGLKEANQFWDTLFPNSSSNALVVYYKDLVRDFRGTIQNINTFLGHDGLPIPEPPIQKQTHPLKKSFEKLFVAEYKQRHRTR